ncbi:MAG TPA: adenosine monophosphate-protein transferase [Spirochaetia bacterium]|nr:adenosine monophosphate-protein transferase [Spirochaetia bacterium]
MDVKAIDIAVPEGCNVVVGQAHFIKTAEDLAEIVVTTVPDAGFGLAFCEASGPCLIRTEGNDSHLIQAAADAASAVGAGHSFFLFLKNAFPINLLDRIKNCQEVARVFCATANPLQILIVTTGQGAGIVGVVDGASPKGVESEKDRTARRELLRKFGYKF